MDFKRLLTFLTKLNKNNQKEWFDANKKEYETLRKEWLQFVGESITTVGAFEPNILSLEPKQCIFRINRDVRFSADKSPYKTNFGMSLNPAGKKATFCGYYLHVEPGNIFVAGGSYMPPAEDLAKIRQEIDYNVDEFKAIVAATNFKKLFGAISGEKLVRPPKGYDAENPAVEFLKYKSFIAQRNLTETELVDTKFMKTFIQTTQAAKPLVDFLNEAVKQ